MLRQRSIKVAGWLLLAGIFVVIILALKGAHTGPGVGHDLTQAGPPSAKADAGATAAIDQYNAEINANKNDVKAWEGLAETDFQLSHWSEALGAFNEVLTLDPKYPHLYSRLAVCATKSGDPKAYQFAKQALTADPNDIDALNIEVNLSKISGFALQDVANIQRLATLQPDDSNTIALLANVLIATGRYTEAKPVTDHYLQLQPSSPDAQFMHAAAIVESNPSAADMTQAMTTLKKLITDIPGYYLSYRFLGRAYMHQNHWKQAADMLSEAAKLKPNKKEIYFDLVTSYTRLGDHAHAAAAQTHFDQLQNNDTEALKLEKLVANQPDDFDAVYRLGVLRLQSGELRAARRYLGHAVQLRPNDPAVQQSLSDLKSAGGESL